MTTGNNRASTEINFDRWLADTQNHRHHMENITPAWEMTEGSEARRKRLIRSTEAMCVVCQANGLSYAPLSAFLRVLEDDLAALTYFPAGVRPIVDEAVRAVSELKKHLDDARLSLEVNDKSGATSSSKVREKPVSETVRARRQAILDVLPRSDAPPLKNQAALRQALSRKLGGLKYDPSTISRDLDDLRDAQLVEKGFLRRLPRASNGK